jgi:hypothetical protein
MVPSPFPDCFYKRQKETPGFLSLCFQLNAANLHLTITPRLTIHNLKGRISISQRGSTEHWFYEMLLCERKDSVGNIGQSWFSQRETGSFSVRLVRTFPEQQVLQLFKRRVLEAGLLKLTRPGNPLGKVQ